MQRGMVVLGFALSVAAIVISAYAVLAIRGETVGDGDSAAGDLRAVERMLSKLEERVAGLEATRESAAGRSHASAHERRRARDGSSSAEATVESPELQDRIDELAARLSELEDVETMAAMVRSGEERLVRNERRDARLEVLDRSLFPEDRLEALERLGKPVRQDDELVAAMCEIALDTSIDGKVRSRAIETLWGFYDEGVKRGMLHIVEVDEDAGVRRAALVSLYSHATDSHVLDAIRRVADYDRQPSVQSYAATLLSKLEWSESAESGK